VQFVISVEPSSESDLNRTDRQNITKKKKKKDRVKVLAVLMVAVEATAVVEEREAVF
jgi:hypothetical protein